MTATVVFVGLHYIIVNAGGKIIDPGVTPKWIADNRPEIGDEITI